MANIIRCVLFCINLMITKDACDEYFMGTYTTAGIIAAVGLFMYINSYVITNGKAGRFILFLASNTYYVYLFHWIIKDKLSIMGYNNYIYSLTRKVIFGNIVYDVILTATIFCISLVFSVVIKKIYAFIKCIVCRHLRSRYL